MLSHVNLALKRAQLAVALIADYPHYLLPP